MRRAISRLLVLQRVARQARCCLPPRRRLQVPFQQGWLEVAGLCMTLGPGNHDDYMFRPVLRRPCALSMLVESKVKDYTDVVSYADNRGTRGYCEHEGNLRR